NPEVAARATTLLAAVRDSGHTVVAPDAYGPGPREAVHGKAYLDFLATIHAGWQDLAGAAELPAPSQPAPELLRERELVAASATAGRAAGYRSLWDAPEVEFSPALRFLFPRARPRKRALEVSAR
ncbi:MAG TPA: hypothetical protein VNZ05_03465, partial [Solirubrobacteraceae bacterium]|nr:hypothetical protein [Solirubrobacteraceae bacterium]